MIGRLRVLAVEQGERANGRDEAFFPRAEIVGLRASHWRGVALMAGAMGERRGLGSRVRRGGAPGAANAAPVAVFYACSGNRVTSSKR
jgi:hypothetical protein